MSIWTLAFNNSMGILKDYNFSKPITQTLGATFFDIVNKDFPVTVAPEVAKNIWDGVIVKYREKFKDYPELHAGNPRDNASIIARYKSDLVREFLKNNPEIFNHLLTLKF